MSELDKMATNSLPQWIENHHRPGSLKKTKHEVLWWIGQGMILARVRRSNELARRSNRQVFLVGWRGKRGTNDESRNNWQFIYHVTRLWLALGDHVIPWILSHDFLRVDAAWVDVSEVTVKVGGLLVACILILQRPWGSVSTLCFGVPKL